MALSDVQSAFEKKGTRIGVATSISAGTPTVELRDANTEVWPTPKRAVSAFDVRAGGSPMIRTSDYVVGRPEPQVTVRAPFTIDHWLYSMLSLMQKAAFAVTKYTITPYTEGNIAAAADGDFLVLEAGLGAASVFKMYGVVAQTVNLSIPTSGSDGGRPEVSTDYMGASVTIADSFSGSPSVSTNTVSPSTAFSFKLDESSGGSPATFTVVDFQCSLSNGVDRSPNIGSTADAMFLGFLTGSGSISLLLDSVSNGQFDQLMDDYQTGTPWEIQVLNTSLQSDPLLDIDVMLMDPTFSVQGNANVATFPFEIANYSGNSRPQVIVTHATVGWNGE